MTAKVIPFKPGHLDLMNIREEYLDDKTLVQRLDAGWGMYNHTLVMDNVILLCGGMDMVWDGVADLWSVTAYELEKYPVESTKKVLNMVNLYERELKLHRVQSNCRKDFGAANRWLEALGFGQESVMEKFGSCGNDYCMYVRIN